MCDRNPLAQLEEEKREHDAKMKKMESEMEQVFEMKVKEKKQKLRDSEADVSFDILNFLFPGFLFFIYCETFFFFFLFSCKEDTNKCDDL